MPCYHPIEAVRVRGEPKLRFAWHSGLDIQDKLKVPCGRCVGCRLERSRQWAMRCVHEASLWPRNVFVTLTYNDANLPADRSLDHRHFQLFMKRLRKKFGSGPRFYMCGEYGETTFRPHYHVLLFNCDFPDKVLWRKTKHGHRCYRSSVLEELWPFGFSEIADVTFQSAAYVARYVMKKRTGDEAQDHYEYVDPVTGQVFQRKAEYNCMSRRPGIGSAWFDKFSSDVYPGDFVVVNGKRCKPPRFYDNRFKLVDPLEFEEIQFERIARAEKKLDDNTPSRLYAKEQVALARVGNLIRPLE